MINKIGLHRFQKIINWCPPKIGKWTAYTSGITVIPSFKTFSILHQTENEHWYKCKIAFKILQF